MSGGHDTPSGTALIDQLTAWKKQGLLEGVIDHWHALLKEPNAPDGIADRLASVAMLLNKQGINLFGSNHIEEALSTFKLVLRARPDDAPALNNAATCLKELGQLAASNAYYERALVMNPGFIAAHDNLLMNMHYDANTTPEKLYAAHEEWDQRHAMPLAANRPAFHGNYDPERPLSIGFVSADLGDHPVGYFLVRYLENIDRANFKITGYVNRQRNDPLANRLRAAMNDCHDTHGLDDQALAQKIADDGIDILIDLSGHTEGNRLGVFAHKPAPVQISWLGYPGDNGLSAMDYVIGDPLILPLTLQPHMRARILHLPDCFVCFDPPANAPQIGPLPAETANHITFGCFSNPAKCGPEVIKLWADILKRLPAARLLLKYKGFGEPVCRDDFTKQFIGHGIDTARLAFEGSSPLPELFKTMQTVDIALDPFPFSGGLMSCLTLWMGLPIITLPMESFASRQGLSFLTAIGLPETIARNPQDYVDKAVALANDAPRLATLWQKLRPAMESSPLCNGPRAAAALQTLLRDAWREKCLKQH